MATPRDMIINALRSGEYTQVRGRLRGDKPGEFCALGVICKVYLKENKVSLEGGPVGWEPMEDLDQLDHVARWAFGTNYLPDLWYETCGEHTDIDGFVDIVDLNDIQGLSFKEIADLIEDQL